MLLAILDKRLGYQMGIQDVFVNIVGGLKIDEPSLDLAVVSAIASSNQTSLSYFLFLIEPYLNTGHYPKHNLS